MYHSVKIDLFTCFVFSFKTLLITSKVLHLVQRVHISWHLFLQDTHYIMRYSQLRNNVHESLLTGGTKYTTSNCIVQHRKHISHNKNVFVINSLSERNNISWSAWTHIILVNTVIKLLTFNRLKLSVANSKLYSTGLASVDLNSD